MAWNQDPTAVIPPEWELDWAGTGPKSRIPPTGALRDIGKLGDRSLAQIGPVRLESGTTIPDVHMVYETWGTLAPNRDNVVLVLHALTGDSHLIGNQDPEHPTPGWWDGVAGVGQAIDTDRWFVIAPNVLGGCQGTTGPASIAANGVEWGSRFPYLTIRDQVEAQRLFLQTLGVTRLAAVLGGSMGGMHALEWAITHPDSVERVGVLAAPAATSADQIALNSVQLEAIRSDPAFHGGDYYDARAGEGPSAGLSVARRLAMITYRGEDELNLRFERQPQSLRSPLGGGGKFAVESYLDFHGNRFTRRFDANSYIVLTEAMNSHDITRDRAPLPEVLAGITARSLVLGVTSDRYFPLKQQLELARHMPHSVHGSTPWVVESPHGHDAFLIDAKPVSAALRQLLAN